MNKIKYRAWDLKKNMWVTDYLIDPTNGDFLCRDYLDINLNDELDVMPCINLTDKNDVEIYKNDIVQTVLEDGTRLSTFVIKWDLFGLHYYKLRIQDGSRYPAGLGLTMDQEVIGNIYENPELLETVVVDAV